jgi:ElaB/YqjD/DUF883 family membrane-anchored ribosome-binding protein
MEQLDVKRITAEVAARHGILLKEDDPALVLVTISQIVLEESFERVESRARGLLADVDACLLRIQERASTHLKHEVESAAVAVRDEIHRDIHAARLEVSESVRRITSAHSRIVVRRWVAVGIFCAVALLLFGVMIGRIF